MDETQHSNIPLAAGIISVFMIISLLVAYLYFGGEDEEVESIIPDNLTEESLGEEIFEKVGAGSAVEDLPEVDPTANPIKDIYKNPFE